MYPELELAEDEDRTAMKPVGHFWREIRLFILAHVVMVGAIIALIVGYMIVSGHVDGRVFDNAASLGASIIASGSYLAVAAFVMWRAPSTTGLSLSALGLRRLRLQDIVTIGFGLFALIISKAAFGAIIVAGGNAKHAQAGFEHVHAQDQLAVAFFFLQAGFIAPLAEELVYRLLLFRTLATKIPWIVAATLSALLFGALHGDLIFFPTLAALGFINAVAYYRSGNIFTSVILHSANNLLASTAILAGW